eukprot:gnl/MRDRNA2_/MRDRNA2_83222_c0_seq1.p1 gnl/MRDRNA2_/MRDRNA2_83222_c0~~gnl/MRDRNA2_/MRDRNA2_83222_c0_seq1.p1  ORF type:complete len:481 (-),score=56.91 gnl/MRDRNA2_/MRDRNA2_83222_c0_seq1:402-1766(-)
MACGAASASLFLPIRAKLMCVPNALILVNFGIAMFCFQAPLPISHRFEVFALLAVLMSFAWIGARRNENNERLLWQQLVKSRMKYKNQKQHLIGKQQELIELQSHIDVMLAMMQTTCAAVAYAGENLCIVQHSKELDELLGEMQGHYLEDRIVDASSKARFHLVTTPVLSQLHANGTEHDDVSTSFVLVPPIHFKTRGGHQSADFEAEVLVADTGRWHGSGNTAWRYLIGLKNIQHKGDLPHDSSFGVSSIVPENSSIGQTAGIKVKVDHQWPVSGNRRSRSSRRTVGRRLDTFRKRGTPSHSSKSSFAGHPKSSISSRATVFNAEANEFYLKDCDETLHDHVVITLRRLIFRINFFRRNSATFHCCAWHAAAWSVQHAVKKLRAMGCQDSISPLHDKQCIVCKTKVEDDEEICEACGDLFPDLYEAGVRGETPGSLCSSSSSSNGTKVVYVSL